MKNDPLDFNNSFKTEVRYRFTPDEIEIQNWQSDFLTNTMRKVSSQFVNLREKAVKEALIAMGWSPPDVHPTGREKYFSGELKRVRDEKNEYLKESNQMKEKIANLKEALKIFIDGEEANE